MPAIPDSFYTDLTTVKGRSRTTSEFQHLLNPPSVLIARGISITDEQRYQLVREVARGLAFLHRIGVCVGDISPKNVLFSLNPRPAVYFLDCDAMRVNGVSALPQMETPEWEIPAGEELATTYSDTYKLGVLALRLLVGDQHTKNPADLPLTTPKPLRQLITDTLTKEPDRRPVPEAWTYLLGHVIDEAQHKPTDPPVTKPAPAMTYSPEPPPVVLTPTPPFSLRTSAMAVPTGVRFGQRPKWLTKRTAILAAAIVGIGGVGIFAISQYDRPPLAVFDGTFTATYGAQSSFSGENPEPENKSTLTWVVRSICKGDQCVAAATTKDLPQGELSILFDYVDGRWLSVYTRVDSECGGTQAWVSFSLEEGSGGSLAGDMRWAHADGTQCNYKGSVEFTRIGGPDPNVATVDLAGVGARKVSPAQALRGAYRYTVDYKSLGKKFEYDYRAETLCIRSGERCLTFFFSSEGQQPLIFAGEAWSHARSADNTCSNGQSAKEEISLTVPLPDPRYDPIAVLAGTGVQKTLTGCPGSKNFDVTIQRTGD